MNRQSAALLLDAYGLLCDINARIPNQKTSQPLLKSIKEDVVQASEAVKMAIVVECGAGKEMEE